MPFDSKKKKMSTVFKTNKKDEYSYVVKGAPEIILEKCTKILFKNG